MASLPPKKRLGEYLQDKNLLSKEQLDACLGEQKVTHDKLGVILVRNGFVTKKDLVEAILSTNPDQIHSETFFSGRVPLEMLLKHKIMLVTETDTTLYACALDNEKQAGIELQGLFPDKKIVFVAGDLDKIDGYLEDVRSMLRDDAALIDRLLRQAFAEGVSDMHIVPKHSSYSVLYRRLGVRRLVHEGGLDEYNTLVARIKDLSRMDLAERRVPQDGGFQGEFNGKLVDLRVSVTPTVTGEYVTIRLLDPDSVRPSLDGLGISAISAWRKGISRPYGLCLICGPTGSGKTTTLNATVKEMNRFSSAIFTLEDPVEYRIPYVGQVNVNPQLGLDFARGVRSFMRMDPDVIIVGEIRDAETARNAVKAAETGHLVLGTLHTGSIQGAIQRLKYLDVPAYELTYLLRSVLVQRLLRVYCDECHGVGCPACAGTGYAGRRIVSECAYFPSETEVDALLRGERSWKTMLEDAIDLEKSGKTSKAEVVRVFGAEAQEAFDLDAEFSKEGGL